MIEDFKNKSGRWVRSKRFNGKCHHTRSDYRWSNMRNRCIEGGFCQIRNPTYVGCTMSENFQDFQFFVEWSRNQIGYQIEGYDLDKDILVLGNKEYHENKCVFIPHELNAFLKPPIGKLNLLPGVTLFQGRYVAQISIGGANHYLGLFSTEIEANNKYAQAKKDEAERWYNRLKIGEFLVDTKVLLALERIINVK